MADSAGGATFAARWKANNGRNDPQKLHHYWTRDPRGLRKWVDSPHPWTSLHRHLIKFMDDEEAKRCASQWFHEVFGFWSGSDLNRVTHGRPPRGKVVGPG